MDVYIILGASLPKCGCLIAMQMKHASRNSQLLDWRVRDLPTSTISVIQVQFEVHPFMTNSEDI